MARSFCLSNMFSVLEEISFFDLSFDLSKWAESKLIYLYKNQSQLWNRQVMSISSTEIYEIKLTWYQFYRFLFISVFVKKKINNTRFKVPTFKPYHDYILRRVESPYHIFFLLFMYFDLFYILETKLHFIYTMLPGVRILSDYFFCELTWNFSITILAYQLRPQASYCACMKRKGSSYLL